jgi:phospholipase C
MTVDSLGVGSIEQLIAAALLPSINNDREVAACFSLLSRAQMASNQNNPIEHVVVLMLENRSFDQMLVDFQRMYPNLDGIDPAAPRRSNVVGGQTYEQLPTSVAFTLQANDAGNNTA